MGSQSAGPSTYATTLTPLNPLGGYRPNEGSSKAPSRQGQSPKSISQGNLKLDLVPPEFKKEGGDWHVVYNPKVKKALDINLLHAFKHPT